MNATKILIRLVAVTTAAIVISGCASTERIGMAVLDVKDKIHGDVVSLKQFTIADVKAADDMAKARGDLAGSQCYPVLLSVLEKANQPGPPILGAVSAFEAARLVVRPPGGNSNELRVACSALLAETVADILKFDAMIAKAVATGGITAAPEAAKGLHLIVGLLRGLGVGQ